MMLKDRPPTQNPWFEEWFDSEYYSLLYQDRDEQEARQFIDSLLGHLDLPKEGRILDLACGNGRHAVFLANKGYEVVGLDLAENQIAEAKDHEHKKLSFRQHDMREQFGVEEFDAVFNFFTSFGYFEDENDNFEVIRNVYRALKPGGVFVLDFMNIHYLLNNLKPDDTFEINEVLFHIHRYLEGGFVKKNIEVRDGNMTKHFQEKVKAYDLKDMTYLLRAAGFRVKQVFGDYQLNLFDKSSSDRLILVSEKQHHA